MNLTKSTLKKKLRKEIIRDYNIISGKLLGNQGSYCRVR